MSTRTRRLACAVVVVASLGVGSGRAWAAPFVFESAGAAAAAIQPSVDAFRAALGTLNGNLPQSFPDGRREINWDGVPTAASDPNAFPADFFNGTTAGRARGVQLSTPGTGFLVSANAGDGPTVEFGFPNDFATFSAQKLFTAINSNITDVTFFVPGTTTAATVSGFGAVFTDVEVAGATRIDVYDATGGFLFGRDVLVGGNESLSFLGILFNAGERIGRVRLTSGANTIVSNGVLGNPNDDVVAMDDFIFGEPQAAASVPEPVTMTMLALGVMGMAARRRVAG